MKEISIFLASSGKLSEERTEIERLIARMNDNFIHKGIYLRLRIWEKLSSTFETGRKQDKFNDEVLKSDIFLCLVYDRIGQFSKEEFDNAYVGLLENGKPKKMYVYFNNMPLKPDDIPEDYHSVTELKELIKKYEQIYNSYENIDELIRKVKDNLELGRDDVFKVDFSVPENSQIRISLMNILGREKVVLFDGFRAAGDGYFEFNISEITSATLPSGTYMLILNTNHQTVQSKMIIVR